MDKVGSLNRRINQAYEQAPWRRQIQSIGVFLLVVVAVALVAGINLSVTSRAATMGREIQDMTMGDYLDLTAVTQNPNAESGEEEVIPIEELKIQIADLEAELAMLTSSEAMQERAEKLGFKPVPSDSLHYMKVPGYQGREEARMAPPTESIMKGTPVLPQAYRESLLDWLRGEISRSWLFRSPSDLLLKGVNP